MFFAPMPSKYIAGSPFQLSGMGNCGTFGTFAYGMGTHPSAIGGPKINYYTGQPLNFQPMSSVLQTNYTMAPNLQNGNNTPYIPSSAPLNSKGTDNFVPTDPAAKMLNMQLVLENAKNEQGVIGKAIDTIKGMTGIGISSKKCQQYIDNAKAGQTSYEEAYENVSKYALSQKRTLNTISGIASAGLALLAITKGKNKGINIKNIFTAAGVGAVTKTAIKFTDRSTNNVQQDAFDPKSILKDSAQGALNGVSSIAALGLAKNVTSSATSAANAFGLGSIQGVKAGMVTGAGIGAGDYALDCAFDKDEKFDVNNFIKATAYSATATGLLGGLAGGIKTKSAYDKLNPKAPKVKTKKKTKSTPETEPTTVPESKKGTEPTVDKNNVAAPEPKKTGTQSESTVSESKKGTEKKATESKETGTQSAGTEKKGTEPTVDKKNVTASEPKETGTQSAGTEKKVPEPTVDKKKATVPEPKETGTQSAGTEKKAPESKKTETQSESAGPKSKKASESSSSKKAKNLTDTMSGDTSSSKKAENLTATMSGGTTYEQKAETVADTWDKINAIEGSNTPKKGGFFSRFAK